MCSKAMDQLKFEMHQSKETKACETAFIKKDLTFLFT